MASAGREFLDANEADLSVNDLIQVRTPDSSDSKTYYSRINDIADGKLVISWPTNGGIRLIAHRDQMLQFYFVRNEVPHEFAGMVDEISSDDLPHFSVIVSSAIVKIQRRQNFRIKALIPVEILGQMREPKDDSTIPLDLRTVTCDLSASGMAIRHPKRIPEETVLEARLSLPDGGPPIKIPCKVAHSETGHSETQALFRIGIQYLALSESERARIVRYVYRTQLKGLHP